MAVVLVLAFEGIIIDQKGVCFRSSGGNMWSRGGST